MRGFLLAVVIGLAWQSCGRAQPPPGPAWGVPGTPSSPAYRHFLHSPYSYRTYSALTPGYATERAAPFSYQSSYVDPGYLHQRITPYGFYSYSQVPGRGGITATPFGSSSYTVPAQVYEYVVPPRPLP